MKITKAVAILLFSVMLSGCSPTASPSTITPSSVLPSKEMSSEVITGEVIPSIEPSNSESTVQFPDYSAIEIPDESRVIPVYPVDFTSEAWVYAHTYISRIGMTASTISGLDGSSSYEEWYSNFCVYGYEYFRDESAEIFYLISIYDLSETGAVLFGDEPCHGILATLSKIFPQVMDCDKDEIIAVLSDALGVGFEWVEDNEAEKNWIYFCKFSDGKEAYSFIIYAEADGTISTKHGAEIIRTGDG